MLLIALWWRGDGRELALQLGPHLEMQSQVLQVYVILLTIFDKLCMFPEQFDKFWQMMKMLHVFLKMLKVLTNCLTDLEFIGNV